jgi:hypothetical protein
MKQLEATPADQFMKELAVGERVTGRILHVAGNKVTVQLAEGVEGTCVLEKSSGAPAPSSGSLAEQLAAAWKGGVKPTPLGGSEPYQEGQLRSFTVKAIEAGTKKIELAAG